MQFVAVMMVALAGLVALPALAQQAEAPMVCRDDVKKLCAGVRPGEGRIQDCLKAHEADLSERCKAMVVIAPPAADAPPERDYKACQGEVRSFCKDVEPGEGRIKACLFSHAAELSAPCRVFQSRIKD